MGVIKKQATQSSILLYLGTLIGFVTTGLLAPNLLSASEIGTLRLLMSYSGILAGIGALGFCTVTIRFLPIFQNDANNNYRGFLGISMLMGVVGFLITWAIIELIKPQIIASNINKSREFAEFFFLIIPLTLFQIYYTLFDFYNNALYRSSYGVFLRDFLQRILILAGLLLLFLHYFSFVEYLYYYVIAICLPTLLFFIHLWHHRNLDLKIDRSFLTRSLMGSMASIAAFGLANNASAVAIVQIDSIMLNMFLDSEAVGIYTITFYFGTLVLIPAKAFNKISPTIISKAFKENDIPTVRDVYYKGCNSLFIIGSLVMIGLIVNLENVFHIIPKSYEDGKYVIILIGIANLIKMSGGSNDSIITFSSYYKLTTLFLLMMVVLIIGFNYLLIPIFGMNGAALAALLSILIHNVVKTIIIKRKFDLIPYNLQYPGIVLIGGIICFIVYIIPDIKFFILDIMVDSILASVLFYFFVIRLFPIAEDIKKAIDQVINQALSMTGIKTN